MSAGAAVVFPLWSLFDHVTQPPPLAASFLQARLVGTVVVLGLVWVLWATPAGRRWPAPFAMAALAVVQLTIGWMVPQVADVDTYLLGATLLLYACATVVAVHPGWSVFLLATTVAGIGVGILDTGAPVDRQGLVASAWFLGSAAVTAGVGHVLRWTSLRAEVRWRSALEVEQSTTAQLVHELRRLSVEDSLTGLANRRCWDDALAAACAHASADGGTLTLVIVDVDHFKSINDGAGHASGDAVLQQIAAVLHQSVRAGDLAARLGGDEMALLLPDIDPAGAAALAERVRRAVAGLTSAVVDGTVTVSVGVASARGADATPQGLTQAADANLYRAKATRNRVVSSAVQHEADQVHDRRPVHPAIG